MSFVESRLLDCVSYGTQGGPTWSTRKVALRSGIVRRNAERSRPMYRYLLLYQNIEPVHYDAIIHAFNACLGGVFGFRLKDWSDYLAEDEYLTLGTGAEQTVQLYKLYAFGNINVSRPIRKPVSGTVTLTDDGSPLAAVVDYTTGEVTFTASDGGVVRWSGEFDVPVMFEQDELLFQANNQGANGLIMTADMGLVEDLSA
jgi:uncharacterized protein (TIGR02217 family)